MTETMNDLRARLRAHIESMDDAMLVDLTIDETRVLLDALDAAEAERDEARAALTDDTGEPWADRAERHMRERDALLMEAQIHAQEARTANSTVNECYQVATGATGESGNWHGAEPIRKLAAERDALRVRVTNLEEALRDIQKGARPASAEEGKS